MKNLKRDFYSNNKEQEIEMIIINVNIYDGYDEIAVKAKGDKQGVYKALYSTDGEKDIRISEYRYIPYNNMNRGGKNV